MMLFHSLNYQRVPFLKTHRFRADMEISNFVKHGRWIEGSNCQTMMSQLQLVPQPQSEASLIGLTCAYFI